MVTHECDWLLVLLIAFGAVLDRIQECDIDELCAELAQKATCDGNTKVIEAQKIMDIVHSIPERAKQRKMSMATRALMA